jgi:hypothetical protein
MSPTVEGSSRSTASVEDVWSVWTDPAGWLGGPVEAAELHGTFETGNTYTTKLRGFAKATATITRVDAPDLWISVVRATGLSITVEHAIEPFDGGTLLTERWTLSGPLAMPARLLRGSRIQSVQRDATAHLARVAAEGVPRDRFRR